MHIRCGVTASIARFQFKSEQIGVRFPATELLFLSCRSYFCFFFLIIISIHIVYHVYHRGILRRAFHYLMLCVCYPNAPPSMQGLDWNPSWADI